MRIGQQNMLRLNMGVSEKTKKGLDGYLRIFLHKEEGTVD